MKLLKPGTVVVKAADVSICHVVDIDDVEIGKLFALQLGGEHCILVSELELPKILAVVKQAMAGQYDGTICWNDL